MYQFLLVLHAIIAAALVGVILMQRSEGGGLAGGGNPAGLMTARGAADLLTRTTTILATLFVALSIAMAALATINRTPTSIDTSLAKKAQAPAPIVPMAGGTEPAAPSAPVANVAAPIEQQTSPVPLAAATRKPEPPKVQKTAPKAEPIAPRPIQNIFKPVEKPAEKAVVPTPAAPAATPPADNAQQ
jgi:preprotein translocase subunit SecG